jgi:ribosomal protein L35
MELKYNCEKCMFQCNYLSQWNDHLVSKKHTDQKRKERNDKVLDEQCKFCSYNSKNSTNMKLHILTNHSTKEERQTKMKYYCENCDFGTNAEVLFNRHLETKKHMKTIL